MNSPQDVQKFRQCLDAAERGNDEAQFYVAFAYESGIGVQEDKNEAFRWYMKAASNGNDKAQFMIGVFYEKGIVVKTNQEEALKWYLKAAEQGNATAQNQLGAWYFNKENPRWFQEWWNKSKAFKWFSKGADQGNSNSQTNLGHCYFYGCGTKKDLATALEWYMKAAEQNNPIAQFQIGYFYENGITVQENRTEALKWYRKAAAQGSTDAQQRIDVMSRRIDSNPKTNSSSNTNSDGNLNQTTDDNSGCLLFFIIAIIFITCFAIAAISQADKKQKKSSNYTTTNNVSNECSPTNSYKPCTDSSTGLFWSTLSRKMDWHNALVYCPTLREGGFNNWRLPNIDELRTLVKNRKTATGGSCKISEKNECLSNACANWESCAEGCNSNTGECVGYEDGRFSKLGDNNWLWSFSVLEEDDDSDDETDYAYSIHFSSGIIDIADKNNNDDFQVRCVRSQERNTLSNETYRSSYSKYAMTWNDAINYCKNLNEYGYSHWRLPNIDELREIITNCQKTEPGGQCKVSEKNGCLSSKCWYPKGSCYCKLQDDLGQDYSKLGTGYLGLWSSSERSDNTNEAWDISLTNGYIGYGNKNAYDFVFCVRNN